MSTKTPEKRILIVEDEQLIAHSIERSLFKAGYVVPAMAASAQEAFEQIEETKPDLVLMDIHIQGPSDGVETARTIRERYHLPVIYLTAHADMATLERAKITEPLGYLVKPVNHANLPSSIEMALYKHKMDRQLEEHRALLSTILHSIAEAVIVTDAAGNVQFMNRAAELLTEWSQADAAGKPFDEVAALETEAESSPLARALAEGNTVQLSRDTTIRTRLGNLITVDGQVAVSKVKERAAGTMITLHDATLRRQEEQQIRQQQNMLSMGQMANDVAGDFYGLLELITSCSEELIDKETDEQAVAQAARVISRASGAGVTVARQLLDLGRNRDLRPELLNLNEILGERIALYNQMCGFKVSLETRLEPDLDLVLSHALHLEKLALNLVLSAKHSMPYGGKIVLSTANTSSPEKRGSAGKRFVRLLVDVQRNAPDKNGPLLVASPIQNQELTLTVVNAIVAVSEGSISTSHESELHSVTEVLLPSVASVASAGAQAPYVERRTVLAIGLDASSERQMRGRLEDNGFTVLRSSNVQEASLVSEFVEGPLDLLIIDGTRVPALAQHRILSLIASRWPGVKVMAITFPEQTIELPQAKVLTIPYELDELVTAAKDLITPKSKHVVVRN